ncbi:MAG: N-acetylmuramoyl-L-alanine amidase, partial [Bacillus sp. (in: Bacteria)]|nr:N-acetylmuramoyl-L-alanine amidase [Bacillus sp. (in: firmicutes)]
TTLIGIQNISGWFLDVSGVEKIDVLVDGTVAGQATYGDARSDVQKSFPQYNNGTAGFHYALDTTQFSAGQHNVTIRATGKNSSVTTLPNRTITIQNTRGYIDNPVSGTTLIGTQNVSGWFLDVSGVEKIDVMVYGAVAGQAAYGDARSDVQNAFPQYNNGTAGFHYALDTTQFSDGQHTVTIRVTGKNGRVTTLPKSTITIKNTRGYMDNPVSGKTLRGTQNVSGWFLDVSGVKKIDVLVDGTVAGQSAYGDARSDVQNAFPLYNNGTSGFHYALDTTQFTNGQHAVTIRVTGMSGRVTALPNSTITINNENPIGYFDNPVSGTTLKGIQNVSGWFLDVSGVEKIDVLVDGTVAGQAAYGDARTDVQKAFPQYNNGTAGFHYALNTSIFSDGQHTVTIRVTGKNGRVTNLPNSTITIKNENAKWYLDNPISGAILRGTKNVSGWFLNESGVENIDVLVDGAVVGQATYGDPRSDIQKAFPQYNNGTAGFHYALDTTQFAVGKHTITIRVTGKNGRVTTLPSSTVMFNQSRTLFLDPGHGGSDPGATAGGYNEADLNLAVAKKVQSLLLDRGYTVYMSRNNNTTLSLLDRSQMANELETDIFVSIHTNSTAGGETTANGIESYYYQYDANYPSKINGDLHNNPERISKSVKLTNLIQDNLIEYTGANDRGTDGETFSVVRESSMPATLIEMGFINNSSERKKLVTDSYQNIIAKAIADGIDEYFNIY